MVLLLKCCSQFHKHAMCALVSLFLWKAIPNTTSHTTTRSVLMVMMSSRCATVLCEASRLPRQSPSYWRDDRKKTKHGTSR
uniref:Putative secreted peptide n=1 Tax=Anopheles braziliensis TaxID=58242 RepID=A0A2M3ZVR9_9DIPT